MQNTVVRQDEKGKYQEVVIFYEYTDLNGFVIREMLETKNQSMRFQAGNYIVKAMRIPVYLGSILTHHKEGDDIQKFELHGLGKTKEEALTRASNKLLRREMKKHQTRLQFSACGIGD
jgi:hypothetical protein